jgi:hypothetical protein
MPCQVRMGNAAKDGITDVVDADGGDGGATVVRPGPLQQRRTTHLSLLMPRLDMVCCLARLASLN